MKNFHLPPLFCLCAIALAISSCTLEKEPEIPTGASNITNPAFFTAEVMQDTGNKFLAKAWLGSPGNLNILRHGWVWGEAPEPTVEDDSLDLGKLTSDSFSAEIAGFVSGKLYYLRPYVTTGTGTIYGGDICSFTGVNFTIDTDTEIFHGAEVQFTNTTVGNYTYLWDFGDGTATAAEISPKHTFNQDTGNVTVRLTAKTGSCQSSKTIVLKIIPDPFEGYWKRIAGGSFTMGCTLEQDPCNSDEYLPHTVALGSFDLGKTEVTQKQWTAVMGDNPSFHVCGQCPVEQVSWDRVVHEFIPALERKTGRIHRLPTEAEWEYAARGGADASSLTTYSGSDSLDLVGWYLANSDSVSHPVAQKLPNALGLYDMSGNVWEWVQDDYHDNYNGAPQDGSAWTDDPRGTYRVDRGGNFRNPDWRCRTASRYYILPYDLGTGLGFRLAR